MNYPIDILTRKYGIVYFVFKRIAFQNLYNNVAFLSLKVSFNFINSEDTFVFFATSHLFATGAFYIYQYPE